MFACRVWLTSRDVVWWLQVHSFDPTALVKTANCNPRTKKHTNQQICISATDFRLRYVIAFHSFFIERPPEIKFIALIITHLHTHFLYMCEGSKFFAMSLCRKYVYQSTNSLCVQDCSYWINYRNITLFSSLSVILDLSCSGLRV